MGVDSRPFEDVRHEGSGFSIPRLKWRELVFVGALGAEGELWVRDGNRPLPPFRDGSLFPEGARFRVEPLGERVLLVRVGGPGREGPNHV